MSWGNSLLLLRGRWEREVETTALELRTSFGNRFFAVSLLETPPGLEVPSSSYQKWVEPCHRKWVEPVVLDSIQTSMKEILT